MTVTIGLGKENILAYTEVVIDFSKRSILFLIEWVIIFRK